MREHFKALLGVMLTLQAVTASAAVAVQDEAPVSTDRVRLIEPTVVIMQSELDSTNNTQLVSTRSRSATADVMNLPAEPIPTPPAFAMGMTVMLGLLGYKALRRFRLA